MRILAHRGASRDAAENTLSAFREAVRQGADGVELDVMRCRSGELVVCHDERLDRLARLPWVVAETPWWKLQRADVGSPLGFAPERMPLLEEVVDVLPGSFLINIEIKFDGFDDRGLSDQVADFVMARGLSLRAVVSSFNPLCLLKVARRQPEIRRGQLIDPDKAFFWQDSLAAPVTGNWSIHPHFSHCTEESVARWKRRGLQVMAWTVDDVAEAKRLRVLGVDAVITNQPRALRAG